MGGRQCGSISTHIHYLALESETRVSKGWDKDSGEKGIQVEDVNKLEEACESAQAGEPGKGYNCVTPCIASISCRVTRGQAPAREPIQSGMFELPAGPLEEARRSRLL